MKESGALLGAGSARIWATSAGAIDVLATGGAGLVVAYGPAEGVFSAAAAPSARCAS
jgi:hypothetical protein